MSIISDKNEFIQTLSLNNGKANVLCLFGATASGKTKLAMDILKRFNVEIISVDSALIYKGMDIGTAKPTKQELSIAPHHLIDIIEPNQSYNAHSFSLDCLALIKDIINRGKTPLLVGGTMLYYKALIEGLSPLPLADKKIRTEIEQKASEIGWNNMHLLLEDIDPTSFNKIKNNDSQRISRALEVYYLTGKSLTQLNQVKPETPNYNFIQISTDFTDRAKIHADIELRFDQMLELGFEQEVIKLIDRGDLNINMPSIRCVGYRQMWNYLHNQCDFNTMRFTGICATRQLAKRQITWIRGWKDPIFLAKNNDKDDLYRIINLFLD